MVSAQQAVSTGQRPSLVSAWVTRTVRSPISSILTAFCMPVAGSVGCARAMPFFTGLTASASLSAW